MSTLEREEQMLTRIIDFGLKINNKVFKKIKTEEKNIESK